MPDKVNQKPKEPKPQPVKVDIMAMQRQWWFDHRSSDKCNFWTR
jgi:hypothetical protein